MTLATKCMKMSQTTREELLPRLRQRYEIESATEKAKGGCWMSFVSNGNVTVSMRSSC